MASDQKLMPPDTFIFNQDALEINFSCPHGMPERKMGAAVGQDCALLEEVCGWINEKATVPVWAKMTPNVTDITEVCFLFPFLSIVDIFFQLYILEEVRKCLHRFLLSLPKACILFN